MSNRLCDYVDPFIGVDGAGNTLCGPYLPFSLVRLGPDTIRPHKTNGYNSKLPIMRFSHTHVSGTGGGGRYGNAAVTPFCGPVRTGIDPYDREDEQAAPGYYKVLLKPAGILAELTVTPRSGLHRYTFPAGRNACLMLDACSVLQRDFRGAVQCDGGFFEWITETEAVGRGDFHGGWGHDFPYSVFFYARFAQKPLKRHVANIHDIHPGTFTQGQGSKGIAEFGTDAGTVELRVGISFVSVANARAAFENELPAASFDEVRAAAENTWERMLSRIKVEGGTEEQRKLFYTFFTRLVCMPTDLGVDDENPAWKSGVRHFWDYYCLWDSVRNANSLLTLIDEQMEVDQLNCLLDIAEHIGWLPDAWIAGHSAQIQGGSSADILFNEAHLKGLPGIDYERALQFMRKNNEVESPDPLLYGRYLAEYRDKGYLTTNVPKNCVSKHMEYSYQDWCISSLAGRLGYRDVAENYLESSRKLWNLWSEDIEHFAPRNPDGSWVERFDPMKCRPDSWNDPYFYEGPSMRWTFSTHHDFGGLVARRGGKQAFAGKLNALLEAGYTFNNETSMHVPYTFIYAGRPDLTAKWIWHLISTRYSTARNGLPDNEDMGSHSAYYMCSSMGLYPLMGQDIYWLTTPFFERVEFKVGGLGHALVIEAPGVNAEKRYIVSATLNGRPLERAWIKHAEIAQGGVLHFECAERPGEWGQATPPPSPLQESPR